MHGHWPQWSTTRLSLSLAAGLAACDGNAPATTSHPSGPCPHVGMVLLKPEPTTDIEPFCLEDTEVSVAEYMLCVSLGGCRSPEEVDFVPKPEFATWKMDDPRLPINYIEHADAAQYCEFVGGRLPTEQEWVWAAGSGKGWKFAWGNRVGPHSEDQYCGEFLRPGYREFMAVPCPAKQHPSDRTTQGIYDMTGGLDEWVAADADGTPGYVFTPGAQGRLSSTPVPYEVIGNPDTMRDITALASEERGFRCAAATDR